jgi:hypothetical protein
MSRDTWTVKMMRGSLVLYVSGFCPWRTPIGVTLVAVAAADDAVDELDARVDDIARHENYCSRSMWTVLVVASWIVDDGTPLGMEACEWIALKSPTGQVTHAPYMIGGCWITISSDR